MLFGEVEQSRADVFFELCQMYAKKYYSSRLTSTEDYFLSDGLYVPTDQLENQKPLHLNVRLVNPTKPSDNRERNRTPSSAKRLKLSDDTTDAAVASSSKDTEVPPRGSSDAQSEALGTHTQEQETADGFQGTSASCSFGNHSCQTTELIKDILQMLQKDAAYVLDIDLDFFSVKNPFKEIYTQVTCTDVILSVELVSFFFFFCYQACRLFQAGDIQKQFAIACANNF